MRSEKGLLKDTFSNSREIFIRFIVLTKSDTEFDVKYQTTDAFKNLFSLIESRNETPRPNSSRHRHSLVFKFLMQPVRSRRKFVL